MFLYITSINDESNIELPKPNSDLKELKLNIGDGRHFVICHNRMAIIKAFERVSTTKLQTPPPLKATVIDIAVAMVVEIIVLIANCLNFNSFLTCL